MVTPVDTLPLPGSGEVREAREARPPREPGQGQGGSPVSMKALLEAGVHFMRSSDSPTASLDDHPKSSAAASFQ